MAWSIGINNPFLRPPGAGAAETGARGAFYGARIRTGGIADSQGKVKGGGAESKLYWVYGKKTWANCGGLGFPSNRKSINESGLLTLYSPRSNLPLLPILTSVSTSNEGAMGSIIKATISFTMYPSITQNGVVFERIQSSFFKPGATVGAQFGWSTYAAVACASRFGFSGKVTSFSWSVNTDVSVNASTSVISTGAVATGITGNLSKQSASPPGSPQDSAAGTTENADPNADQGAFVPFNPLDAKQIAVHGTDLATCIDRAMAIHNPLKTAGSGGAGPGAGLGGTVVNPAPAGGAPEEIYGIKAWEPKGRCVEDGLTYISIGIPWQPEPPETDEVSAFDESAVAAANGGSSAGTAGTAGTPPPITNGTAGTAGMITKPIVKQFWYVNFGSMEQFLSPLIRGATNGEIGQCDINNDSNYPGGRYTSAYPMEVIWNGSNYGSGTANPGPSVGRASPIGGLWFNTDFVKSNWRKFFNENSTEITQKNLTSFLNSLCARANEAAGDFFQLSTTVVDKFSSCGGVSGKTSVLAVEDFSYCPPVGAFSFNASFGRPMLKNVSVSCKSSSTMGAAVMAGGNVDTPGKKGVTWGSDPAAAIGELRNQVEQVGINTAWGDAFKGALKLQKKADAAHHSKTMILFPIDFSVTIDGCSGWQFNEAVNTNLKPPGYGGSRFAISGISNSVDASTWETSINAIMRA
jgi:hypothetical protein